MKTRAVDVRAVELSLVLPGSWSVIPLDDDAKAKRIATELVKRQVGRDDRLAQARRETKLQLFESIERARLAGAFQIALSLEILPGIPFPASMIFSEEPWNVHAPTDADLSARLLAQLPGAELLDLEPGLLGRAWRQTAIRPGTETVTDTKIDYVVPTPDGARILRILVDAPIECDPGMIVALFDAIVDSVRWREQLAAGQQQAQGAKAEGSQ